MKTINTARKRNFIYDEEGWKEARDFVEKDTSVQSIALRGLFDMFDLLEYAYKNSGTTDLALVNKLYWAIHKKKSIASVFKKTHTCPLDCVNSLYFNHASEKLKEAGYSFKYAIRPVIPINQSEGMKMAYGLKYDESRFIDKKMDAVSTARSLNILPIYCDIAETLVKARMECGIKRDSVLDWIYDHNIRFTKSITTLVSLEDAMMSTKKNVNYSIMSITIYLAIFGYELRFYSDFLPLKESTDVTQKILDERANNSIGRAKEMYNPSKEEVDFSDNSEQNFLSYKYRNSDDPALRSTGDWYAFLLHITATKFNGSFKDMIKTIPKYRNWTLRNSIYQIDSKSNGTSVTDTGVNTTTLVDFVSELGYDVYPELNPIEGKEPKYFDY